MYFITSILYPKLIYFRTIPCTVVYFHMVYWMYMSNDLLLVSSGETTFMTVMFPKPFN